MPQPHPPTTGRIFAILVIFLYLYSAPDPYAGGSATGFHSPREQYNAYLSRQRHAFQVLNSTRYGDFRPQNIGGTWLNLTGFGQSDGYAWEGLEKVRERVEKESEMVMGVDLGRGEGLGLYKNVTGVVHGTWVRSPIENKELLSTGRSRMNLTNIAPDVNWGYGVWNRNITGREGNLMLVLEEKDDIADRGRSDAAREDKLVSEVSATMTIGDESNSGDGWEMRLHGVHWIGRGALVMTTTSAKFAGIFGLPHLTTKKEDFETSQALLNRVLDAVLKKKEKSLWIDLNDPWSQEESVPVPHCEYVVYIQVQPVKKSEFYGPTSAFLKDDLATELADIEQELRFPNGAPTHIAPPLQMSLKIFSPDCGFALESKGPPDYSPTEGQHLRGLKQEVFSQRVKRWSLLWGVTLIGQVLLIRMQMKESSTPSTLSRISYYTVTIMLAADSLLFGCLMLLAASAPSVFPTATLAAFAVSLCLGMGVRFVADVYNVQEPERRERARQQVQATQPGQLSTAPATAPVVTSAGPDSLPLPVTAARPATAAGAPIIIPSDQDVDAEVAEVANAAAAVPLNTQNQTQPPGATTPRNATDMASSYGQYVMVFMLFFFLTVSSASWPTTLRSVYVNTLAILYLSFWVPQIYRNIIRNCRKAFLWKFVLGQSMLRIVPFLYFFLKEDNVLFAETKWLSMMVLAGWLWIQIWVLAAQEVLGPRFGLPKGWLPEAWDYHPLLREDDSEGGGMPIGLVQALESPRLERVKTGEEGRKKADGQTWSVDCAICMHPLDIPVMPAGEDGATGAAGGVAALLARRLYMVTPCRHAFHSVCLEGWMRFRLQCPICRENLPPL